MDRPISSPLPQHTPISHYENFPVASWLCPAHLRAPIAAIYHFARTADDLADEGDLSPAERLQALADYRVQLSLACIPTPSVDPGVQWDARWAPLFAQLKRVLQQYPMPTALFHDLLDAFVQDVENTRDQRTYATQSQLLDYCRLSANPVGRLLLNLYQVQDPQSLKQSDAICSALQLINFWQDPSVDLPRGRIYFTDEMLQRHGVSPDDLKHQRQTSAVAAMLAQCVAEARTLMQSGAALVHQVPGRAGWELRLVVQGGLRILDLIEAQGFSTLQRRPTLRKTDYLLMLWRAIWM